MVLANDGRGTNVLKDLASVSYLILPERISQEEEEMQKQMIAWPEVLGEDVEDTKMRFYDEVAVLGARADREIQEKRKKSLLTVFLENLEKTNRFILGQWGKVFDLFR